LRKQDIPTPALLLDLDAFDVNLARMMARVRQTGKQIRPHFKAHKCAEIAKRQMAAGAVGVCVATVVEAELVASARIPSLLLTSPVADPGKMARVAALGSTCRVMAVTDHLQQVAWYDTAARAAGTTLDLLVDLDVGDHRTGAATATDAMAIAQAIHAAPNLNFRGIQAYSVLGSHAGGYEQRKEVSTKAIQYAAAVLAEMQAAGLPATVLTGGSTGTWEIDTAIPEFTELQAGSFVLMDIAYRREGLDFTRVLTVLGTVVSANHPGLITTDAGTKAFSTDRGYGPEAPAYPDAKYRWGGDEFGYLEGANLPSLGAKIEFVPPHCDPTVNLYDRIYAMRGEVVEDVWGVKRLSV
jgi:D-serine deaminase-like pyridoxal phosphate-dependent protein